MSFILCICEEVKQSTELPGTTDILFGGRVLGAVKNIHVQLKILHFKCVL